MDLAISTSCAIGLVVLCLVAVGLAGAWVGLTVQHCGNHGAMSTSPVVNKAMGLTDDLIGGSSLMWRYHHQVTIFYNFFTSIHYVAGSASNMEADHHASSSLT